MSTASGHSPSGQPPRAQRFYQHRGPPSLFRSDLLSGSLRSSPLHSFYLRPNAYMASSTHADRTEPPTTSSPSSSRTGRGVCHPIRGVSGRRIGSGMPRGPTHRVLNDGPLTHGRSNHDNGGSKSRWPRQHSSRLAGKDVAQMPSHQRIRIGGLSAQKVEGLDSAANEGVIAPNRRRAAL